MTCRCLSLVWHGPPVRRWLSGLALYDDHAPTRARKKGSKAPSRATGSGGAGGGEGAPVVATQRDVDAAVAAALQRGSAEAHPKQWWSDADVAALAGIPFVRLSLADCRLWTPSKSDAALQGDAPLRALAALSSGACVSLDVQRLALTVEGVNAWTDAGCATSVRSVALGFNKDGLRKVCLKAMTPERWPALEDVSLHGAPQVRGCWMTALTRTRPGPALRRLCVSGCPQMADKGLRILATRATELVELHLSQVKGRDAAAAVVEFARQAGPSHAAVLKRLVVHPAGSAVCRLARAGDTPGGAEARKGKGRGKAGAGAAESEWAEARRVVREHLPATELVVWTE